MSRRRLGRWMTARRGSRGVASRLGRKVRKECEVRSLTGHASVGLGGRDCGRGVVGRAGGLGVEGGWSRRSGRTEDEALAPGLQVCPVCRQDWHLGRAAATAATTTTLMHFTG